MKLHLLYCVEYLKAILHCKMLRDIVMNTDQCKLVLHTCLCSKNEQQVGWWAETAGWCKLTSCSRLALVTMENTFLTIDVVAQLLHQAARTASNMQSGADWASLSGLKIPAAGNEQAGLLFMWIWCLWHLDVISGQPWKLNDSLSSVLVRALLCVEHPHVSASALCGRLALPTHLWRIYRESSILMFPTIRWQKTRQKNAGCHVVHHLKRIGGGDSAGGNTIKVKWGC